MMEYWNNGMMGYEAFDRQVPRPAYGGTGGVKGHNINEVALPGSPALWAGSFTLNLIISPQHHFQFSLI
jgi:hypothetical protein